MTRPTEKERNMMKKVLSCLLAVMLFLTCIPTAMAVDNARDFFFV